MPTLEYTQREQAINEFVANLKRDSFLPRYYPVAENTGSGSVNFLDLEGGFIATAHEQDVIAVIRNFHRGAKFNIGIAFQAIDFMRDMIPPAETRLILHPNHNPDEERSLIVHPDHIPNSERSLIPHPVYSSSSESKHSPPPMQNLVAAAQNICTI